MWNSVLNVHAADRLIIPIFVVSRNSNHIGPYLEQIRFQQNEILPELIDQQRLKDFFEIGLIIKT